MVPSVVLCQNLQTKDSIKISYQERDSIVSKLIQRKALLIKTDNLEKSLIFCDSAKAIKVAIINEYNLKEVNYISMLDSLSKDKHDLFKVISNNKIQIENEKKIGRRKGFWNFVKGALVGGGIVGGLILIN